MLEKINIRTYNEFAVNARIHGKKVPLKGQDSGPKETILSKKEEDAIAQAIKQKFSNKKWLK